MIKAATLLANDTDPNNDILSISAVSGAQNGMVVIGQNGDLTFTPNAGFTGQAQFTYTASDGKSGTDTAKVVIDFQDTADQFTFWNTSATPAILTDSDTSSVNLGLKFTVETDGEIDALRYYKSAGNVGPHSGYLWSDTGTLLAKVDFTNESNQGWQQATLSAPIKVSANQTFVVSYFAPKGGYSVTENYFTSALDVGPMTAIKTGGVYAYGGSGVFPTQTHLSSNYWVDVVFDPANSTSGGGTGTTPNPIGEAGAVTFTQTGSSQWFKVTFAQKLDNPSVVMGGLSSNDADPGTMRVRNVTDYGFEFQLDEWDYLDGKHGSETVRWVAIEQGVHTLSNGQVIEAGSSSASGATASVGLTAGAFSSAPRVLAQVATTNDARAVTDRVSGVTTSKFNLGLIHEEAKATNSHGVETVDWIAVQNGGSGDVGLVAGRAYNKVGDGPATIDFTGAFTSANYAVIADLNSVRETDTADLRFSAVTGTSFTAFADEEQSKDAETGHAAETVAYFATDIGLIYADLSIG